MRASVHATAGRDRAHVKQIISNSQTTVHISIIFPTPHFPYGKTEPSEAKLPTQSHTAIPSRMQNRFDLFEERDGGVRLAFGVVHSTLLASG